ncbi:MAG: DJ-1/PfpI family protein [Acidimicrobiales bacterium]
MRIGILLFDGVDLLDAGGPYEVFLTASRLAERSGDVAPFEVVTLTKNGAPVTAYGGLGLEPHASVADAGPLDVVVVPGTIDVVAAQNDSELLAAIAQLSVAAVLTTSVCTGAFLLASVGLLENKPWTTHWEDIDDLAEQSPSGGPRRGVRWVDSGDVITSAGLSAGIDMALHVVDRLAGSELALRTARQIDYDWHADPSPQIRDA